MTAFKRLNSACRTARLVLVAILLLSVASVARAQTPQASFERSTLTGSGNTINATRVPVAISSTLTVYVDMTMQFNVDSNGNLTMVASYPRIVPSATLLTGNFKAGTYVGPSTKFNAKGFITVSGPGVSDGGTTTWSMSAASSADPSTNPSSATWYVGPIANNPQVDRLKRAGGAGITSTAWSYGVASGLSSDSLHWAPGTLIGVSQTGNAITFASFSFNGTGDYAGPQDQVTFTLVP
jgi:hypothetical protein